MTRLQKKCFLFSAGMHGLLGAILVCGSAFRAKPSTVNIPIMTMIPARILDEAGAGGGSPEPVAAPQPPPPAALQAQPSPAAPVVQLPQPVAPPRAAEALERPKPREIEREPTPQPAPEEAVETKPARKTHEIHPDFTPATPAAHQAKTKARPSPSESAESSASAQARRIRQQIAASLDALATGVKSSGAQGTVVDMPGQGGGEAFAGYETVIYNVYYHAWMTPDSVANKLAAADAKIVVARDGTILSADIINKSGEAALDKSVGKVLRAVTKLPPFPATARDEQRTFIIRFNLTAKEASG
jgi:outer membrane biosynthesis protein TonB